MVPLALKHEILTRMSAIEAPATELPATILYRSRGELYVDRNSCPAGWPEGPAAQAETSGLKSTPVPGDARGTNRIG
jgi:hypothetical protein